ncbi:rhodanese-like domain-containing protein [Alkalicoccus chagannorensis]|uniref:rhodanese-like domain-containing protein n=1 Tax=Alkalicoccus chagannorensis TaxID=427072 RepID=UPI0004024667|nr:rhodanese-like domain-containing protein [Alkalicoccus chagannorensis]
MSHEVDGITQINTEELKNILQQPGENQVIIDVREPEEYEARHIPGVPLVPMMTLPQLTEGLDKEKEYIFVCRRGNRSHKVSQFLKGQGYSNVINYEGGMTDWDGEDVAGPESQLKTVDELKGWTPSR